MFPGLVETGSVERRGDRRPPWGYRGLDGSGNSNVHVLLGARV